MKIVIKNLPFIVLVYLILVLNLESVIAQSDQLVFNPKIQYEFMERIEIEADINNFLEVDHISIILTSNIEGLENSVIGDVSIDENYRIRTSISQDELDIFKAFTIIKYKFIIELLDGSQVASQEFEFYYEDNRFDWISLENENFIVYRSQGDVEFSQSILDAAQNTLPFAMQLLNNSLPTSKIEIYVYPNPDNLQRALALRGQEWIVGHASPETNIILVSIEPSKDEIFTTTTIVPHEITHILLFYKYGLDYKNLPVWLNEGIASYTENYGVGDPDGNIILNTANDNNSLLSFTSLCNQFPQDANQISTAYSQSASMVRFILDKYGQQELEFLAGSYADGNRCENVAFSSLKMDLAQLEDQWIDNTFVEKEAGNLFLEFIPWMIIFGLIFIAPLGYYLFRFKLG